MATNSGVQEAPQPKPVELGHLMYDAKLALAGVTPEMKADLGAWKDALNKQGTAALAKRALERTQREGKHFYDGRDLDPALKTIKDKATRDRATVQVNKARIQMAIIDIYKFPPGADQDARLKALIAEGKISATATIASLTTDAVGQIVAEPFFTDWAKQNKIDPLTYSTVAKHLFLRGPMSDELQFNLREGVGALQEAIAKLPQVEQGSVDKGKADKKQAQTLMDGVEKTIQNEAKAMAAFAKGVNLSPDQESSIKSALEKSNSAERASSLTRALVEINGVTPAGLKVIDELTRNRDLLQKANDELTQAKTTAKKKTVRGKIAKIEGRVKTLEGGPYKADIAKYEQAKAYVSGVGLRLLGIYDAQKRVSLQSDLLILGGSGAVDLSEEAQARAVAEQQLLGQIEGITPLALDAAIEARTKILENGAVKAAEYAEEAAIKAKDEGLQKALITCEQSFRDKDRGISTYETEKGAFDKDKKVETFHIDRLVHEMNILGDYDSKIAPNDGTDFVLAYRAGLLGSGELKIEGKQIKIGSTVVDPIKALADIRMGADVDKKNQLNGICSDDMRAAYRGNIFAEYMRAQKYHEAGGRFGLEFVRKMKGVDVKFTGGDQKQLDLMVQMWDKIMLTHHDQIETAINKSKDAQDMIKDLREQGLVGADRKKMNWIYALLMALGVVLVPGIGLGAGALSLPGLGLAGVGGAAGFAGARKTEQFIQ